MDSKAANLAKKLVNKDSLHGLLDRNTSYIVTILLSRYVIHQNNENINVYSDITARRLKLIQDYPGIEEAIINEIKLYKLNQLI